MDCRQIIERGTCQYDGPTYNGTGLNSGHGPLRYFRCPMNLVRRSMRPGRLPLGWVRCPMNPVRLSMTFCRAVLIGPTGACLLRRLFYQRRKQDAYATPPQLRRADWRKPSM